MLGKSKSNELILPRSETSPGWIDLGYGEPVLLLDKLVSTSGFKLKYTHTDLINNRYQPAQGNKALVTLLENKYGSNVVITTGAKQGISAVCYALRMLGHNSLMIHSPYWSSMPSLIKGVGLNVELNTDSDATARAFMVTSPNNPDGKELTNDQINDLVSTAQKDGVVLIHDAAYYTPVYVRDPQDIKVFGDAQIHSVSKMYGLSGLRVGYVVVRNDDMFPHIVDYIEKTVTNVSSISQDILLDLEIYFLKHPRKKELFDRECRDAITKSRSLLKNINPDVLTLQPCESNSMFAWFKVGPKLDLIKSRVHMLSGDAFGKPGYIRMNIAVDPDLIQTVIDRLNDSVE